MPVKQDSPVASFGASSVTSGTFGTDREAERLKKREQMALLREQKKAALAAKKSAANQSTF